jgi:hypothetical protein
MSGQRTNKRIRRIQTDRGTGKPGNSSPSTKKPPLQGPVKAPSDKAPTGSAEASKQQPQEQASNIQLGARKSAPVDASPPQPHPDYDHLVELRNTMMRRSQWLELRAAKQGIETPPSIYMEIEDIQAQIERIDKQLSLYQSEVVLNHEEQKVVVEALAAMGCSFADRIRVIKIIQGSIVLEMEMPLAGAARLMALQMLGHPQLARKGITNIDFAGDIGTWKKQRFAEAISFELQDLQGGKPSETSPFANHPDTIPLRITIASDKIGEWYHLS